MENAQSEAFEHTKTNIMISTEVPTSPDGTPTPAMLGKLDALRLMLNRAEDLRMECYRELGNALPACDFAHVITAPLVAIERLRALHQACMEGQ